MNTFNDTSGEPEQDANSALTELDKGMKYNLDYSSTYLRSSSEIKRLFQALDRAKSVSSVKR